MKNDEVWVSAFHASKQMRDGLREPFAPEQIGKLPKPYKKENPKGKCGECGGYHGLPAMHLDFVGHAAVTDRLNHEAPDWYFTVDVISQTPDDQHVIGVLGTMTIGGKSIQEAGAVDRQSSWGEELKLAISDFIRRGAMRFGVALDLWSKEDLKASEEAPARGHSSESSGDVRATSSRLAGPSPDSSVPSTSVAEGNGTGSSLGGEADVGMGKAHQVSPPDGPITAEQIVRLRAVFANDAAIRVKGKKLLGHPMPELESWTSADAFSVLLGESADASA